MEEFNKLSLRMLAVTKMLTGNAVVADIGCDHAFVSIYLIKNKIAPKVIAMDVRKGPLEIAKTNVKNYLADEGKIEIRMSDGFSALKDRETEAAIIAGMGGPLIIKILENGSNIIHEGYELVLQPQSEIKEVRKYLKNHQFDILCEDMVFDEGKYYTIIKARKCEQGFEASRNLKADDKKADEENADKKNADKKNAGIEADEIFDTYGEYLIANKNQVFCEYLDKEISTKKKILDMLRASIDSEKSKQRFDEVEKDIIVAKKALSMMLKGEEYEM